MNEAGLRLKSSSIRYLRKNEQAFFGSLTC
jgi:hypothetical protein